MKAELAANAWQTATEVQAGGARLWLWISLVLLSATAAFGQGTINFSTRVSGEVVGHVYGFAVPEFMQKWGNTATETPAGTQTYLGSLLTGSGYSAQLWFAIGSGQTEDSLSLVAGSTTTFRTGATLGGTPAPLTVVIPGVAPRTGVGTFQVRAWNNAGGTITSWFAATQRGRSALFEVTNLGDGVLNVPANMDNFRSFNIYSLSPEPSPAALFTLGAVGWWLFRRGRNTFSANQPTQERKEP